MRIATVLMLCLLTCSRATAAEKPLTNEQFLTMLEVLQQKVRDIDVHLTARQFSLDPGTGEMEATPYYYETRLVMAGIPGSKVRLEIKSALPWYYDNGTLRPEPGVGMEQYAFNGKVATYIRWLDSSMSLPLHQHIEAARPATALRSGDYQSSGLSLIAAYYDDVGLAQRLRTAHHWTLTDAGNDVYVVRVGRAHYSDDPLERDITVDLKRGGAITGIRDYRNGAFTGYEYGNVVLRDCGDGVWLPESAECRGGGRVVKYSFTVTKINQDPSDSAFVLAFMPGYQVWNKINNLKYVAAPGDDRQPDETVDTAVGGLHDIMTTDANADTRGPRTLATPAASEPSSPPQASAARLLLLAAVVVLAAALVFIGMHIRNRRRSRQ